jgi:flagellar basal-body rod modification protein FlgD
MKREISRSGIGREKAFESGEGTMAAAAIFHHALMAGQATKAAAVTSLNGGVASTSGTSGSSGSGDSSNSSTISANDFLTLLVTEMQNQDPTQDTDPNEYINQLVQVNSLEQLVDINQTLSTDLGGSTNSTTPGDGTGSTAATSGGAASGQPSGAGVSAASAKTEAIMKALHLNGSPGLGSSGLGSLGTTSSLGSVNSAPSASKLGRVHGAPIKGNLDGETANPAARRVGHALAGRTQDAIATAPTAGH